MKSLKISIYHKKYLKPKVCQVCFGVFFIPKGNKTVNGKGLPTRSKNGITCNTKCSQAQTRFRIKKRITNKEKAIELESKITWENLNTIWN